MSELYISVVTSPLVWLGVGLLAVLFILKSVKPPTPGRLTGLAPRFADKSGLNALGWFAVAMSPIWMALLIATILALYRLWLAPPGGENLLANRVHYIAIVGLMTALAGLVGTPLALIRVFTNERQTKATEEGLTTERIGKAVEGLGAEKEVNRLGRNVGYTIDGQRYADLEWQDNLLELPREASDLSYENWSNVALSQPNLEVRIGAIYALERISQDSPRDHVQIMEILCAYIRENAPDSIALDYPEPDWEPLPDDAAEEQRTAYLEKREERFGKFTSQAKARKWAQALKPRTDIQVAAQVIGRRTGGQVDAERADLRHGSEGYRLDLRGTCLQGVDLSRLDLRKAQLTEARLEGAVLIGARLEGADLRRARLEGADLSEARLEGADLSEARLEGADLIGARLEGAVLSGARLEGAVLIGARLEEAVLIGAQFDAGTNFNAAVVQYAALKSGDLKSVTLSQDQVNSLFGDGSVILPDGITRPAHWPEEELDGREFFERWRAWQVESGYRPRAEAE